MITIKMRVEFDVDKQIQDIKDAVQEAMRNLMMAAYHEWITQVGKAKTVKGSTLRTTRRPYEDAIQHKLVDPWTVQIFLQATDPKDNFLANALEGGFPQFNTWTAPMSGWSSQHWSTQHPSKASEFKLSVRYRKDRAATPFVDIPFRTKSMEQSKPDAYRRMSAKNIQGRWIHPGFRPIGKGGLERPLRDIVTDFVKDEAPKIFSESLKARVTV